MLLGIFSQKHASSPRAVARRAGNLDPETIEGFGKEWKHFDQGALGEGELRRMFDEYFDIFPWESLPQRAIGFDMGCGSGRWAKYVAPRVGLVLCIDASQAALQVAKKNLEGRSNCCYAQASVDSLPLADSSMDFGYALGVLHHVPDTAGGLRSCVAKLKPGAPFLVYLYYSFENRPVWFRAAWRVSDLLRRAISRLPFALKMGLTLAIAIAVYWPLARFSGLVSNLGYDVSVIPLSAYRDRSFYTMRTDCLDRFGTRLEKRFSAKQVNDMMEDAGLERIRFSQSLYWCAVGFRKGET